MLAVLKAIDLQNQESKSQGFCFDEQELRYFADYLEIKKICDLNMKVS